MHYVLCASLYPNAQSSTQQLATPSKVWRTGSDEEGRDKIPRQQSTGLNENTFSLHIHHRADLCFYRYLFLIQTYKAGIYVIHILKIRKLILKSNHLPKFTELVGGKTRTRTRQRLTSEPTLLTSALHFQEEFWFGVSPSSDLVDFLAHWLFLMFPEGRANLSIGAEENDLQGQPAIVWVHLLCFKQALEMKMEASTTKGWSCPPMQCPPMQEAEVAPLANGHRRPTHAYLLGSMCWHPDLKGKKDRVSLPPGALPVESEISSWERGGTKFLLCSPTYVLLSVGHDRQYCQ